jgi:hypothetical protein
MLAMNRVVDQAGDVVVESQGGAHIDIMMLSDRGVKMSSPDELVERSFS